MLMKINSPVTATKSRRKMEIDKDNIVRFIFYLFANLQKMETDLAAYQAVFLATKMLGIVSDLDESLEAAKQSVIARAEISAKYDNLRESVRQASEMAKSGQDLLKAFQEWKPQGPIN
jgi:hypothetical protein